MTADTHNEACVACGHKMAHGQAFYFDVSGEVIHADCIGLEREGYVGASGEPLQDGEPIPMPAIWGIDNV